MMFFVHVQDILMAASSDGRTGVPELNGQTEFVAVYDTLAVPDTLKKVPPQTLRERTPQLPSMRIVSGARQPWDEKPDDEEQEIAQPDTVHIWNYALQGGFEISETDSTLRWVQMVNLFDRFFSEKGAITYRMGTVGRTDAAELHVYENRHMNLEMEGLNMNSPLTGSVNWNRLAFHKISEFSEADYGGSYHGRVRLRDHYLVQPRTYLNFDESKFDNRSLEFTFTQNFRSTTNLELSFWDRRDGGGYSRQGVEGRQAVARAYHQLNHNWLLRISYINNALDRQEPFGYSITDPQFFPFNRFVASPVQQGANSNQTSSDVYVQLHHRRDTTRTVSTKFGIHYQTDKWDLTFNADTVAVNFGRLELFARQNFGIGSVNISATARAMMLNENEKTNLNETSWLGGQAELLASQKLLSFTEINLRGRATTWDDGRTSTEMSGRLLLTPFERLKLSVFAGTLSQAPDIQSLYWTSEQYFGDENLPNEESLFAGAFAEVGILRWLSFGLRGDFRETNHGIFIDSNGNFTTTDLYTTQSGTAWLALDSRMFEGEISGTFKSYSTNSVNPANQILAVTGERIWLKSQIYWKNYVFDRAAFVKAGVSGVLSPNPFRTAEFITPLNRWQYGTNEFINPFYYRMDVDVSARIRWFMLVLKWENILDGVGQLGYFETTGYPMPERRFRFGIRVLFTN